MPGRSHATRIAAERGAAPSTPAVESKGPESTPATDAARGAPPVARVGIGGVQAAIWRQEGEHGDYFTATIERRYQENGEWKTSHSYGTTDLLALAKTADLAVDKMLELQKARGQGR